MSMTIGAGFKQQILSDRRASLPTDRADRCERLDQLDTSDRRRPANSPQPSKRPASHWLSGATAETEVTPPILPLRSTTTSTGGPKCKQDANGVGSWRSGSSTHDGHVFAAFGSSVNGHNVTAYTRPP